MSAARKIYDQVDWTQDQAKKDNPNQQPAWKVQKNRREKLLRAIRSKWYSETIKGMIRREVKKGSFTEES